MMESVCFERSMPASKKARAGHIPRTRTVDTRIHVVSPASTWQAIIGAAETVGAISRKKRCGVGLFSLWFSLYRIVIGISLLKPQARARRRKDATQIIFWPGARIVPSGYILGDVGVQNRGHKPSFRGRVLIHGHSGSRARAARGDHHDVRCRTKHCRLRSRWPADP